MYWLFYLYIPIFLINICLLILIFKICNNIKYSNKDNFKKEDIFLNFFDLTNKKELYFETKSKIYFSKFKSMSTYNRISLPRIIDFSFSKSKRESYSKIDWINEGEFNIYLTEKYVYLIKENLLFKKVFKYSTIEKIEIPDNNKNLFILFSSNKESLKLHFNRKDEKEIFIRYLYSIIYRD